MPYIRASAKLADAIAKTFKGPSQSLTAVRDFCDLAVASEMTAVQLDKLTEMVLRRLPVDVAPAPVEHFYIVIGDAGTWCDWLGCKVGQDIREATGVTTCSYRSKAEAEAAVAKLKPRLPNAHIVAGECPNAAQALARSAIALEESRAALENQAQADAPYLCKGCGRPEDECSANPCDDVIADRGDEDESVGPKTGPLARLAVDMFKNRAALNALWGGANVVTDRDFAGLSAHALAPQLERRLRVVRARDAYYAMRNDERVRPPLADWRADPEGWSASRLAEIEGRNMPEGDEPDPMGGEVCDQCNAPLDSGQIGTCDDCQNEGGLECPVCGNTDRIDIAATVFVRAFIGDTGLETDEDESDDGSHDWDDKSPCVCRACDHTGTVGEFRGEPAPETPAPVATDADTRCEWTGEQVAHTATPWVWHEQGEANEYCLLTSDGKWVISFRQNGELMPSKQRANAEFIKRAVNAHDALFAALVAIRDGIRDPQRVHEIARVAIATVGETPAPAPVAAEPMSDLEDAVIFRMVEEYGEATMLQAVREAAVRFAEVTA